MQTQAKAMTGHKHATTSAAASQAQKKTQGDNSETGGRKTGSKQALRCVSFFSMSLFSNFYYIIGKPQPLEQQLMLLLLPLLILPGEF